MTTLNTGKIVSEKPAYLPFDVSSAIAHSMTKPNPAMAEYALKLIADRLTSQKSDVLDSYVKVITFTKKDGAVSVNRKAMLKNAYSLSPAILIEIIESARESYDAWIDGIAIEREAEAQAKDRNIDKMTDDESRDPMIALADIKSLVNQASKDLALMPKSGVKAAYPAKFESWDTNKLIAAYRSFEHMPLIDDTRRMTAYRAELKTRGLSLQDVTDMWDQIDNPPKQTRPSTRKTESAKRTPADKPTESAKQTPTDDPMSAMLAMMQQQNAAMLAMMEKLSKR